ncbi:MAG: D-glycero-beta-D-manno-heptose 1,7-bisphosphate 7-phosphatase [Promethearchaeota archaeon]
MDSIISSGPNKAVFLDRDGTVNVEINYLHEPEKFKFLPDVPKALKLLQKNGFKLIIVTNQAGIGKGFYDHSDTRRTHEYMTKLLEKKGIHLDGIYYCPHTPEQKCDCRKPSPGMLKLAMKEHKINSAQSWMIGDKLSDIEAGNRIGVKTILVLTGYGREHKKMLLKSKNDGGNLKKPTYIAENMWNASKIILSN